MTGKRKKEKISIEDLFHAVMGISIELTEIKLGMIKANTCNPISEAEIDEYFKKEE